LKIDFIKKMETAIENYGEVVLATMVSHRGSAPQIDGAKVIFTKEGLFWGSIGGGKIEHAVQIKSKEMLEENEANFFAKWNLQKDIGMTCGGEVSIFFEKFGKPKLKIAVFGAGHVSQSLIPLLLKLDCEVKCIDPRVDWIEKLPSHKKLEKVCIENSEDAIASLEKGTFIISMTQGHKYDVPILHKAFLKAADFPYIGVIGSKQKAQVIKADLKELGILEQDLERLFCPIGLNFGSNIPEEIAFSIIGQILTERELCL
tara:strand:+ start:209764 stop:210540 length:777 start_codon:yes stop_codon:yes gene_type:complete